MIDDEYIARLVEAGRVAEISSGVRVRCMRAKSRLAKQRDAWLEEFCYGWPRIYAAVCVAFVIGLWVVL